MADRGIMVQDLFANKNDFINTPTMLKGKSQLKPKKIVRDGEWHQNEYMS